MYAANHLDSYKNAPYIKEIIPGRFKDHRAFNFADHDRELSRKDYNFYLNSAATSNNLSQKEFERVLDCLDKVSFMHQRSTDMSLLATEFSKYADEGLRALDKELVLFAII
jgi:hypothetical protein